MSIAHSTWPVVLINYNLAPWMSMKPEYLMLSLLIPGPSSPGKDIDVYLQPLIEELKELWEFGAETYDALNKQTFRMHAALLWTISDFPAYAMLSGWSTKGRLACPSCNYGTASQQLKYSRKTVYMDHRRFLDTNHPWRFDKKSFNGNIERRNAPIPLSGTEVLAFTSEQDNVFGKKQKKKKPNGPWRKRSIFFELPYWKYNTCRHNLDLMHIEKNICDSLLGTLLDIPGKSKDHVNARFDLQDMGIRKELHPIPSSDFRRVFYAKACYFMTHEEKNTFCTVMKNAKLPQGCASNISRCVRISERKISGYKTHDAHSMMHHLLQVAVRKTLPKHVAIPLIRLGAFFRGICSKVFKSEDLDYLQNEIIEILCHFERIFPPTFFDIMVHLPIHLVYEIWLGGPMHYRWMYFIERYLCDLKRFVRNRSHPEGSIAEGYLANECLTFCSRYMHDGVKTRFKRRSIHWESNDETNESSAIFAKMGHPIGGKRKRKGNAISLDDVSWAQAHRYILFNCGDEQVEMYIREHQELLDGRGKRSRWERARNHSRDFIKWFQDKVEQEQVAPHIMWLSKGPNTVAKRYKGYFINGYRFYTRERDARCKSQNSGVTITSLTDSFASSRDQNPSRGNVIYYGAIQEILRLDYWGQFDVVLFRCDWFEVKVDDYGLTRVNFNKLCYLNDPLVMPSQVHQVFYIEDPVEEGWYYVMERLPRDLFDFVEQSGSNVQNTYWHEQTIQPILVDSDVTEVVNLSRDDEPRTTVDMPINMTNPQPMVDDNNEDSDFDDTDWDWMDPNDS